jgi:hypothetical protein
MQIMKNIVMDITRLKRNVNVKLKRDEYFVVDMGEDSRRCINQLLQTQTDRQAGRLRCCGV